MYDKLLKEVESWILKDSLNVKQMTDYLDIIIKIKTIQALDTSADLIRASRQVGRN